MLWRITVLGATAFWIVMTVLLFLQEIMPYFKFQSMPSYQTMLGEFDRPTYKRYEILLGAQVVGEAEELLSVQPGPLYVVENRLQVDGVPLLGRLTVRSRSEINIDYQLIGFNSTLKLGSMKVFRADAFRKGKQLEVSIGGFGLRRETITLDFPKGMMLTNNFVPVRGTRYLAVGREWKTQMINFDGMLLGGEARVVPAFVRVEERATRPFEGRRHVVYKVEVRDRPGDDLADYWGWVTRDGEVLESTIQIGRLQVITRLVERKSLTEEEFERLPWRIDPEEPGD